MSELEDFQIPDPSEAHLKPLTTQRIVEFMDRKEYHYALDDDGDPTAVFDHQLFWFIIHGDQNSVLQIRGRLRLPINPERRSEALMMLNDAHREYVFPTLFIADTDVGARVMGNYSVLAPRGLTDAQFDAAIEHGVARVISTFERLEREAFGDVFLPAPDDD